MRCGIASPILRLLLVIIVAGFAGQGIAQKMSEDDMAMPTPLDQNLIIVGPIELHNAHVRQMPPGARAGGAFMRIVNTGELDDRLVSARSDAAAHVELHGMQMVDGVMKMSSLPDGIAIPAHGQVEFISGGKHLMFVDVHKGFMPGDEVSVVLTFERAGEVKLQLPVLPLFVRH